MMQPQITMMVVCVSHHDISKNVLVLTTEYTFEPVMTFMIKAKEVVVLNYNAPILTVGLQKKPVYCRICGHTEPDHLRWKPPKLEIFGPPRMRGFLDKKWIIWYKYREPKIKYP
jgi:hypothetical protein